MKIFSNIVAYFRNMKLRRKVFLVFFLGGLLPFLGYLLFSNRYMKEVLQAREKSLTENALSQAVTAMKNELDTYNNLSNYMFNNINILKALDKDYGEDYFEMYKVYRDTIEPLFLTYYALHPHIQNITIYSSCDLHPYNHYVQELSFLEEKEWYPLIAEKYTPTWTIWEEKDSHFLYSTRLIGDKRWYKNTNYLCLQVDYDAFFHPLTTISEDSYQLFVADQTQTSIFSTGEVTEKSVQEIMDGSYGSRYMVLSHPLDGTPWTVYFYKPTDSISAYVSGIMRNLYLSGVLIVLTFGVMVLVIFSSVLSPIETLTATIQDVCQGNMEQLTVELDSSRQDEIGILLQNFTRMMDQIHHYIEVNLKNELEKKTYQQKILYAQINPHFLYNALSLINSKAILTGQEEISNMVILLSSFYRTALNRGRDITTLGNELVNIQSYIQLQLLSYREAIEVHYHIDPSLSDLAFPNFVLQPLVENALDHGLKNSLKPQKCLSISCHKELTASPPQDFIAISIQDNGIGMDEEIVASLFEVQTSGYGIKNVNDRLRLLYGTEYTLIIESQKETGTSAFLKIPVSAHKV